MEIWQLSELELDRNHPLVLRSDEGASRAILLGLPQGESMQEHQVHENAWLMVVEGEAEVSAGEDRHRVGPGALVHFEPSERHEVSALADTRLLLLLAPWPGEGHPSRT